MTRPVAGNPVEGPCLGLDTVGMQPFIGDGFSAFDLLLLSDGTGTQHDHVVTQGGRHLPRCSKRHKGFRDSDVGVTVRWNKEQTDLPMLWVCYGQARVRINVIIQAMSCQGDDGGRANADAISNRMSARVWDLSGS